MCPDDTSPFQSHQSHFCNARLNIILPSVPRSAEWALSLRLLNEDCVLISHFPHVFRLPRPFHPVCFNPLNNIWQRVHAVKFPVLQPFSSHLADAFLLRGCSLQNAVLLRSRWWFYFKFKIGRWFRFSTTVFGSLPYLNRVWRLTRILECWKCGFALCCVGDSFRFHCSVSCLGRF